MTKPKHLLASLLLACSLAAGCASLPEQEEPTTPASSPQTSEYAAGDSESFPASAVSSSPSISPSEASSDENTFSLGSVPAYSGEASVEINGNIPYFSDSDLTNVIYLDLSPLDDLGRAGVANAVLGPESIQTEERGDISDIHPSGWWEAKQSDINVT